MQFLLVGLGRNAPFCRAWVKLVALKPCGEMCITPLSSAVHPAMGSTASGCCSLWLAASPAWFSFNQRKAPHPKGVLCWPLSFIAICPFAVFMSIVVVLPTLIWAKLWEWLNCIFNWMFSNFTGDFQSVTECTKL